ncbi:hypothetical protein ACFQJC_06665 [Haloferax namakaokahaiae]|uniref:DUF7130 domain-containing protein n=1 Tax=Haloferax namakaokahaiae TaxID=1748331 RepID=A0ABD5ZD34_9EURY
MSGRGETPPEAGDMDEVSVAVGEKVFTEDGRPIGRVRGFEEGGVFVTTREGVEALSIEHARSGHSFGRAELMWRCMTCGAMRKLEGDLPDSCPDCQAPKEELMYWTED